MRQARGVLPRKKDWVIADPRADGLFVFVTLRPDIDQQAATAWLGRVDALIKDLRLAVDGEGRRLATVATGFGTTFFTTNGQPRFPGVEAPAGLRDAPPTMPSGEAVAADVVFYVMAVTEAVAARFLTGLWETRPDVTAVRVERGHQRTDGTEVFGFKDGVRNVPRADRPGVVLVDRDRLPEEPWLAENGTYLAYMRIAQNLDSFAALDAATQERMMGRARDGRRIDLPAGFDPRAEPEFTGPEPPTSSHVRKAGPRGADRDRTLIFRRGLPFVEAGSDGVLRAGLQFASFQASLDQFRVVFNRWMMNPNFPQPAPGRADDLFSQGHVAVEKWGFFFVPPDTDEPVGTIMFAAARGTRRPKFGRVAVRKRVLEQSGAEAMVDLANFRFRVLDATGAQVGAEFITDSAGHALSDELPVDGDYTLEELAVPASLQGPGPIQFRLHAAREIVRVNNAVLPGGGGYNP
jgi:deferrochelatase/peroxidase EfeB